MLPIEKIGSVGWMDRGTYSGHLLLLDEVILLRGDLARTGFWAEGGGADCININR